MSKVKVHSKELRQAINLELDAMGMAGPVTRRDVAERLYRVARRKAASADERDAWMMWLMAQVGGAMSEPLSKEVADKYLSHLPPRWHYLFQPMPRFICISPNGGPLAEHCLSINATIDEWGANAELKDHVIRWTSASRDHSRDVRRMLIAQQVNRIREIR